MYNHSNLSQTSTGSGRRISLNNPFRSALIAEEAKVNTAGNNTEEYRQWVENNKKLLQEEEEEEQDYSDDNFDFIDTSRSLPKNNNFKPPLLTTKSDSSVMSEQKYKNNPFADALSPESTGTNTSDASAAPRKVQPQQRQPRLVSPATNTTSRPSVDRGQKPLINENYYDDHDLPPSYEDITNKYSSKEYPADIKEPINNSSSSPPQPSSRSRRNSPTKIDANVNGNGSRSRGMPNLTSTVVTNVSTGHTRTRSRSEGEVSRHHGHRSSSSREHRHRERSERGERSERTERHSSGRERSDREHSHRHHSHSSPSGKHRSSRSKKSSSTEKPKNLDVIDKLDVTGFLGGSSFHHDGPFDACTPHRNKNAKAAPVMAFPADGPNNSIKGAAPVNIKDQQMDMMFGVSEHNEPTYTTSVQSKHKSPYSNGIVVKEASASAVALTGLTPTPGIVAFDSNVKAPPVHGDTTLGLGSSTFLDGAPAYGATSERKNSRGSGELTRKKSIVDRLMKKDDEPSGLIRRVKSLKVSRNRS